MITEIEHPTELDIQKALSELKEDSFDDLRLAIGNNYIYTSKKGGVYHVISSESGRILEAENFLPAETVLDLFLRFKNNDSSWNEMASWKDVTRETKKLKPFIVVLANGLIAFGFIYLMLALFVKISKVFFWIFMCLCILFILIGVSLHLVWYRAGYRDKKNQKCYPVLEISKD